MAYIVNVASSGSVVPGDRVVGILLGLVVTAFVFKHIWPERANDRALRSSQSMAQLLLRCSFVFYLFLKLPGPHISEKLEILV
jgi:hypothetical protein